MAGWTVAGAQSLAAELASAAVKVETLIGVVVEKSAADLIALTQLNASHRPGPNAPTGDYRGSWEEPENNETKVEPGEYTRVVGTNRAQALRLEYGYVGTDSLGRTYDQPPYEHHGPAVDVVEPLFELAMGKVVDQAVRW